MMFSGNLHYRAGSTTRLTHWQGRSGHHYALAAENLDSFVMEEGHLYLIAKASNVLWVGSTQDLVADPMSRSRFRLALDCANAVLSLPAPENRLAAIWDLEGAMPAPESVAQAA